MISREQAFELIDKYLREKENIKYALILEFLLKQIASKLNKNKDLWGLTGLLHNIDYEYTSGDPNKRGVLSAQILEGILPDDMVNAIKSNNYMHTDHIPTTTLDKALLATDATVSLILEVAKTTDSGKVQDVDLKILIAKFNDPSFAEDISRGRIQLCGDIGFDLKYFFAFCLKNLHEVSKKLNL